MLSYCGLKGLLTFEEYMQEIPRLKEELQMRDTESDKTAQFTTNIDDSQQLGIDRGIEMFSADDIGGESRKFERRLFQDLSKLKEVRIKKFINLAKEHYPNKKYFRFNGFQKNASSSVFFTRRNCPDFYSIEGSGFGSFECNKVEMADDIFKHSVNHYKREPIVVEIKVLDGLEKIQYSEEFILFGYQLKTIENLSQAVSLSKKNHEGIFINTCELTFKLDDKNEEDDAMEHNRVAELFERIYEEFSTFFEFETDILTAQFQISQPRIILEENFEITFESEDKVDSRWLEKDFIVKSRCLVDKLTSLYRFLGIDLCCFEGDQEESKKQQKIKILVFFGSNASLSTRLSEKSDFDCELICQMETTIQPFKTIFSSSFGWRRTFAPLIPKWNIFLVDSDQTTLVNILERFSNLSIL